MPERKKKGPKGSAGKKKKQKSREKDDGIPENIEEPPPAQEPWRPTDSPPPDYELLSVTPSMENVRAHLDIVLDHLTKDENVKNYSSEFVRMYESSAIAHSDKRDFLEIAEMRLEKCEEHEKLMDECAEEFAHQKKEIEKKDEVLKALLAETSYRRAREVNTVELVGSLRKELMRIRNWEDLRTGGSDDDLEDAKIKNRLLAEKEVLQDELANFKRRLVETYQALEAIGKEETEARIAAAALQEKLQTAHEEIRVNLTKRNIAEDELREEKVLNEGNTSQIKNLTELLHSAGDTINSLKSNVIEQKLAYNLLQRERDAMNHYLDDLSRNHNRVLEKIRVIQTDVETKSRRLEEVKKELSRFTYETKRLEAKVRTTLGTLINERSHKENMIQEKKSLLAEQKKRDAVLKECQERIKEGQNDVKMLNVKNNTLLTKLARSEYALMETSKTNKVLSDLRKRMDDSYKKVLAEKFKLERQIQDITNQKQKCLNEVAVLALQVELKDEEMGNKVTEIARCKKEIANTKIQLQGQVNAYDNLMFQRNSLAKNLHEHEGRLVIANSDIKMATKCIDQLKDNISVQDNKIQTLMRALDRAALLREELSFKINRAKDRENKLAAELKEMKYKEKNYINEIKSLEKERDTMNRRLKEIVNERNIIGTQLVRKNDEIQILRNSNENFRKETVRGQSSYSDRLDDIRVLRLEILHLRKQAQLFSHGPDTMALRRELFNARRDLTTEMLKRSAMEVGATSVINIHKWRQVQCKSPGRLELIRKVSLLQKRLLKQQKEKIVHEEQLRESDRLFRVLRQALARLSAPAEPVETKWKLAKQKSSIKALIAEARVNSFEKHLRDETVIEAKQDADFYKKLFLSAKKVLQANGIFLSGNKT